MKPGRIFKTQRHPDESCVDETLTVNVRVDVKTKNYKAMKTKETVIVYQKSYTGKTLDSIDYTIEFEKVPKGVRVTSSELGLYYDLFPCRNARKFLDKFIKPKNYPQFNPDWKENVDYSIEIE